MTIADPQSFNRYSYVNNNPLNKVDPTGLKLSDIGIVQTDDLEYAWTLQRNRDAEFQRSINYDYARRYGLDIKEESGGFGSHFTIQQQQDFQTLMPNPKPGEVWFDGYFDEGGVLTWWYGLPYSLPNESAGTSKYESIPDDLPKTEGPHNTSHTACITWLCGGIVNNPSGRSLMTIGISLGIPRLSYSRVRNPGYQDMGLSGSLSSSWPFTRIPGLTGVSVNKQLIPCGIQQLMSL
jgi:hypothetical protein